MITPFLAYMDYWQTGSADLADSFFELLYNNTQIHALDPALGLVNTSKQDYFLPYFLIANQYDIVKVHPFVDVVLLIGLDA